MKQTALHEYNSGERIDLSLYAEPYFYQDGTPTDMTHPRILHDPKYLPGGKFDWKQRKVNE